MSAMNTPCQDQQNKQWYVIRTKPCQEFIAKTHYERQGFQTYLPHTIKTRKHARKIEHVPHPLFPGYLFLHLAPEQQNWTTISSTRGAAGPVRFGDTLPVLPDWIISSLQAMEDQKGCVNLKTVKEKLLKPGDEVSISFDQQRELRGLFLSFHDNDRAIVLLNMLQRSIKTTVPIANLQTL